MGLLRFLGLGGGPRQGEGAKAPPATLAGGGAAGPLARLGSQDTEAAITELSRVVKNDPDAVEIYLALGNLYRSQGEIERAVQIRRNLIVRPGLDKAFKAKAWFELGRDYKRGGFVDRALEAFEKCRALMGRDENSERGRSLTAELARLAAESGDDERAESCYARLDMPVAQAHYMVRRAQRLAAAGDESAARKLLEKALSVSPGSPEAWITSVLRALAAEDMKAVEKALGQALDHMAQPMRFTVLEGLVCSKEEACEALIDLNRRAAAAPGSGRDDSPESAAVKDRDLARAVETAVSGRDPDLLLAHYAALFLLAAGDEDAAEGWLQKSLALAPDFWASRLEILRLRHERLAHGPAQDLAMARELDFFIRQADKAKRFYCRACGLKREQLFFVCPRCQSWHSIGFRQQLSE